MTQQAPMNSLETRKNHPALRPIRGERQLQHATRTAFELSEAGENRRLTRDEADYLEVLLMLIERYESEHYPIASLPDAPTRLAALVESAGMTASDLGRLLGNRSLGNKILRGERELSKAHIRRLSDHFKLSPQFFF